MKKYLITIWSQNPEHYFFIENQINFLLNKKGPASAVSDRLCYVAEWTAAERSAGSRAEM